MTIKFKFKSLLLDSFTDSGFDVTKFESPECLLCEEVIHEVEKKVKNDKSKVSNWVMSFPLEQNDIISI